LSFRRVLAGDNLSYRSIPLGISLLLYRGFGVYRIEEKQRKVKPLGSHKILGSRGRYSTSKQCMTSDRLFKVVSSSLTTKT
jgi:hypothetical protein